jgi:hypothetical protein
MNVRLERFLESPAIANTHAGTKRSYPKDSQEKGPCNCFLRQLVLPRNELNVVP